MMKEFRKSFDLLCEFRLMDWAVLTAGWRRGWVPQRQIAMFAVSRLEIHPHENRTEILLLAGAESMEKEQVYFLLDQLVGDISNNTDLYEKWRLAFLQELLSRDLTWDRVVDVLYDIRVMFDFPADMDKCDRCGPSKEAIQRGFASADDVYVDPVVRAGEVLQELKKKFNVKTE